MLGARPRLALHALTLGAPLGASGLKLNHKVSKAAEPIDTTDKKDTGPVKESSHVSQVKTTTSWPSCCCLEGPNKLLFGDPSSNSKQPPTVNSARDDCYTERDTRDIFGPGVEVSKQVVGGGALEIFHVNFTSTGNAEVAWNFDKNGMIIIDDVLGKICQLFEIETAGGRNNFRRMGFNVEAQSGRKNNGIYEQTGTDNILKSVVRPRGCSW